MARAVILREFGELVRAGQGVHAAVHVVDLERDVAGRVHERVALLLVLLAQCAVYALITFWNSELSCFDALMLNANAIAWRSRRFASPMSTCACLPTALRPLAWVRSNRAFQMPMNLA